MQKLKFCNSLLCKKCSNFLGEKVKKKSMVFIFLLLCSILLAQDAKVMPQWAGRFTVTPSFSFATGVHDDLRNFDRFDEPSARMFNLGVGAEYGVLNWITAVVHWLPGWAAWSDTDAAANDISELFVGAKIQLLGEQAPFTSNEFRFTIAPGVVLPLVNDQVFALGVNFYFDWIFNRNFFVTLSNETLFFPGNQDFSGAGPAFSGINEDANFSLRFGIGSVFTAPIANGIDFAVGLPASYLFLPDTHQHNLGVNPHASLFFRNTPLPLEFKFQYYVPLWGRNSIARHDASLLIRMYFATGK